MNAVFGARRATVALILLALCAAVVVALLVTGALDPGHGPTLAGNGVIHTTE
jgi:hypothetical protein